MFASIESKLRSERRTWSDVIVCDLWAGSGAIALEAWSRGATRVLAVDKAKSATEIIAANIQSIGAHGVKVVRSSVSSAVQTTPPDGAFDVLFADPPYEVTESSIAGDLARARASGWFAADAIVVVERAIRSPSPFPAFVEEVEQRSYGDTALWYGRVPEEQGVTAAKPPVRST
jgi:16S rRNA (guanine966-N2)-methyltransferase